MKNYTWDGHRTFYAKLKDTGMKLLTMKGEE